MIESLLLRVLVQTDDESFATSNFTVVLPRPPTSAPTPHSPQRSRVFLYSTMVIVFLIGGWCLWNRVQKRNEQRRLDYRSAQADRVLGDMQMVPNADLDNELL